MSTDSVSASKYLSRWGFFNDAPDDLVAHADTCDLYTGASLSTIVSGLRLADESLVAGVMSTKPANVLELDHLVQAIPSLREHSLKLLAISRGLPYLETIPNELVDAGAMTIQTARPQLDELNAAFIITPDECPMLIFSDLPSLLSFVQAGRIARSTDPLRQAIGKEPLVALAPAAVVARAAKFHSEAGAMQVVSAMAQDNFWAPTLAKTEAERILARLLDEALMRRATDVDIAPLRDGTAKIRFRIFGDLTSPERHALLSPENAREIINFLVSRSRAGDGGRLRNPADGQITYKNSLAEVFIRCSFVPADRFGLDFDMVSGSLRLLPRTSRSINLRDWNLPSIVVSEIEKALLKTQGLIVLAGPTNSGKSTTIAGVVGEHIRMFGSTKKRLSLEDPVERYLDDITQISVESNFAELMRAMLRHDPDLIWVGEIRDVFSAAACVRAATSGHVVLSTVHANNSILAFRAISNYLRKDTGEATGGGASLFDLAESLSLLIGQRLVKRLCSGCRQPHRLTAADMSLARNYLKAEGQEWLVPQMEDVFSRPIFQASPHGCALCNKSGYTGELPVSEVLPVSREAKELFSKSDDRLDFAALSSHRLNTLSKCALDLIEQGVVEFKDFFI